MDYTKSLEAFCLPLNRSQIIMEAALPSFDLAWWLMLPLPFSADDVD